MRRGRTAAPTGVRPIRHAKVSRPGTGDPGRSQNGVLMRLSKWLLLPVACAAMQIGVLGCENKPQTQKQAATKQWNSARANVLFGLAKDQYSTGNFDQSRKSITEALRLDPDNARARILSAKLAIEQGQLELAQVELDKARKVAPKDPEC